MVNYVDYVTIENSFLDPQFSLGYDWDSYKISFQIDLPNHQGNYLRWEWWAWSIRGEWYYEDFYKNGHWALDWNMKKDNLSFFCFYSETRGENEQQEPTRYLEYQAKDGVGHTGPHWIGDWEKVKYNNFYWNRMSWLKLIIGDLNIDWPYDIGEVKIEVDWELLVDLKPCLSQFWEPYFRDEVRNLIIYPYWYGPSTTSMIKTVVMTWDRQQLPIYDGIDKSKIQNRIIEVNKYDDWYAACYDEISISADEDNLEWIEVSDYTIENQVNEAWVADFIELKPRWTLVLPRNRQISALNRPLVKGHRWDLLRIVVR